MWGFEYPAIFMEQNIHIYSDMQVHTLCLTNLTHNVTYMRYIDQNNRTCINSELSELSELCIHVSFKINSSKLVIYTVLRISVQYGL